VTQSKCLCEKQRPSANTSQKRSWVRKKGGLNGGWEKEVLADIGISL